MPCSTLNKNKQTNKQTSLLGLRACLLLSQHIVLWGKFVEANQKREHLFYFIYLQRMK
jgi:hypothetical protein